MAKSLNDFTMKQLGHAEVAALARLQLFFTSETHKMLSEFGKQASSAIIGHADKEGKLDATSAFRAQQALMGLWGDVVLSWTQKLQKARKIAGQLPFGLICEMWGRLQVEGLKVENLTPLPATQASPQMGESAQFSGREITEAASPQFDPQIEILLNRASEYLYGDGLNLSGRIWQMDRQTRDMINQILMQGVANGSSAWNLAQELEAFLGASEDCPRWTSTRLYGTSKSDIAKGDLSGLISGDACDGQGVAYNALRLARTELQKIHALATDEVLANSPWVEMEQVNLSGAHPEPDECDDVIEGGDAGDGVYPVGTIELPIHPNCLCYKTSVLMPEDEFINKLADWTKGGNWPEMDDFSQFVGGDATADLSGTNVLVALGIWLFSQELKL